MISLLKDTNELFVKVPFYPFALILIFGVLPAIVTWARQTPDPIPVPCTQEVVTLKNNSKVTFETCNGKTTLKENNTK